MKTMLHCLATLPAGMAARRRQAQRVVCPALLLFMAMLANGATQTSWQGSLGDWFIDSNWSNGAPESDPRVAPQNAIISNGGTALMSSLALGINPARAGDVLVGAHNNTSGTLLLTRSGSAPPAILRPRSLYVGRSSIGTVEISRGASMISTNWDFLSDEGYTIIGLGSQARGTLNVQDPGSSFQTDFLVLGDILSTGTLNVLNGARVSANDSAIGVEGTGSLTISSGGRLDSKNVTIATFSGAIGTALITGNSSLWLNANNIEVGGQQGVSGGAGTLRIQNGGFVQASGVKCWDNSVVDVNNGSSSVAGLMLVGGWTRPFPNDSPGDVLVGSTTGGRMEIREGGTVLSLRGHIGFHPGSDGAVNVNGSRALWEAGGSLFIGNAGVGSLEVLDGGSVTSAGHGYLGFAINSSGYANVSGVGSTLTFAQNLFIGGNGGGAGGSGLLAIQDGGEVFAATARLYAGGVLGLGSNATLFAPLTVTGGSIQALANTTFTNSFTVELSGLNVHTFGRNLTLSGAISGPGTLSKSGTLILGPGTLTLTGASDYTGATTVSAGKLLVNGSITSEVTVFSGATLGGNGAVGSVAVNLNGMVAPGLASRNSPGRLTINGNYTQRSGGILSIEIGGYTAGAGGYDQLAASGAATVNGTLNLKLVNGFRPVPGDTFSIITSTGATGNFSAINSPGFTVTSQASASGITLTVTAIEPAMLIAIKPDGAGNIVIRFDAIGGRTYRLERNRDDALSDLGWVPIGEYTAPADGPAAFLDSDANQTAKAFYRLLRL